MGDLGPPQILVEPMCSSRCLCLHSLTRLFVMPWPNPINPLTRRCFVPSSISTPADNLQPFVIRRVADVEAQPPDALWLIEDLWLAAGVGILGGEPKLGKTYLAAEISVAVATGLDALGCYKTHSPGPVLFYGAEGSLSALRSRFDGLALARSFDINTLDVHLLDAPLLQLDSPADVRRLCMAVEQCHPRLLVLDPFVRLMGGVDENSSSEVSAVLGSLRAIQRTYDLAVLVVHHARKSPATHAAQAFRGSSDFAAWSDSNLYLARRSKQLLLTLEHRSARSPDPIPLRLEQTPAPHLVVIQQGSATPEQVPSNPLAPLITHELSATSVLSTVELRQRLRRRKTDVVEALEHLRKVGVVRRTAAGWQLVTADADVVAS